MQNDAELIQESRSGQSAAFKLIMERYQCEAYGHALTLLNHREDAMDAVQESFMAAYNALEKFDETRAFYPWFYVILRNCCYKQLAARKRGHVSNVDFLEPAAATPETNRRASDLQDALLKLSAEDREIVTLKHLDGLKYQELAEHLSIPIGTVMSRLYNARQRLKELLSTSDHSTK